MCSSDLEVTLSSVKVGADAALGEPGKALPLIERVVDEAIPAGNLQLLWILSGCMVAGPVAASVLQMVQKYNAECVGQQVMGQQDRLGVLFAEIVRTNETLLARADEQEQRLSGLRDALRATQTESDLVTGSIERRLAGAIAELETAAVRTGSDLSSKTAAEISAGLDSCGLSAKELRAIHRDNAARLFPQFAKLPV